MSYGRSVAAKVSVGRSMPGMVPHTPLAPGAMAFNPAAMPASKQNHVHVGQDGTCGTCGVETRNQFTETQRQAWGQGCGPGEKRRPLGTTRATVAAGASVAFNFASLVPFKAFWLDVDDQIASDFSCTSIQFGLNQLIVGGAVNMSTFNSRSGKDCTDMFEGCIIYPSIPAVVTVRNNSLEDLFWEATMWGAALITC